MKKDKKKKERKKKVKAFKSVIQNISAPSSSPYFATHYIPPTIRSRDYSEPRIISAFNPFDSFGLESEYPRIASDEFIIQLPQHRIEPTRLRNIGRAEYNAVRDVVAPTPPAQAPPQPTAPFVEEVAEIPKPKRVYKKKPKVENVILEE
jgi:hypothetical protein